MAQQRSEEWFAERRLCDLTGSELGAALGICPYKSRQKLLLEKRAPPTKQEEREEAYNPAISYGIKNEEVALQDLTSFTGLVFDSTHLHKWVPPTSVRSPPKLGSSPDGLAPTCVLEIKTKFSGRLPESVETHHIPQVLAHMECTGRPQCVVWYWTDRMGVAEGRLFVVKRNSAVFNDFIVPRLKKYIKIVEDVGVERIANMKSEEKREISRVLGLCRA